MSRDLDELDFYASPSVPLGVSEKVPEPSDLRLFLQWEKLRILYNLILAAVTVLALLLDAPRLMPLPRLLVTLAQLCLVANIGFCLGPVLDGYARLLGMRHWAVTVAIFAMGTVLAALYALLAVHILIRSRPGFD